MSEKALGRIEWSAVSAQSDEPSGMTVGDRIAFVLGRGRSGTTWIGTMLNASPGCFYKYEPFNRNKPAHWLNWLEDLAHGAVSDVDLHHRFIQLCAGVDHHVDYPPFLRKRARDKSPVGLRIAWEIGRWFNATSVYETYGRPGLCAKDWILVKQVNFPNEDLTRLCEVLHPWLIGVFRGPLSSVDAARRFKAPGSDMRQPAAIERAREACRLTASEELQAHAPYLETMSEEAFEAFRWRVQTEPLHAFLSQYPRGTSVTHERMCEAPRKGMSQLYEFLGWPLDQATVRRFERLTVPRRTLRSLVSPKHTVRQDVKTAPEKWKRNLSDNQIRDIAAVVSTSPLLDHWPTERDRIMEVV